MPVFRVDDEASDYQLWVGGYTGNASDSLSAHNGYKFSTVDRNNDEAPKCCPCAPAYGGGWWFYRCPIFSSSHLFIIFSPQLLRVQPERGVLPGWGGQRLLQGDRLGALAGRLLSQVRCDDGPTKGATSTGPLPSNCSSPRPLAVSPGGGQGRLLGPGAGTEICGE